VLHRLVRLCREEKARELSVLGTARAPPCRKVTCDSWSQEFLLVRWYGSNAPDRRQKGWMGLDRRTLPSSGAKWRALLRRSHRLVFVTPYGSGPIIDLLQAGLRSITSCVSCPGPLFGQEVRLPGAKRPRWLPSTLRSNDILEP